MGRVHRRHRRPHAPGPYVVAWRAPIPLSPPRRRAPPLDVLHSAASMCCCCYSQVVHETSFDGPILPKSWVAAFHVMTRGSKLLQQHRREGRPPRARPSADEEADFRLWLVENKSNPHSFKFRLLDHWIVATTLLLYLSGQGSIPRAHLFGDFLGVREGGSQKIKTQF
jgi:hypothetical protein